MKIRFVLLLLLWNAAVGVASPLAQVSGRKIGTTELGYVESLTVSGDGRFLSVLSLPGEKGSDVYIIDRHTHKTRLLPGSGRATPMCFSRDGQSLWVWGLHLDEPLPGLRIKPSGHEFLALYNLRRECYTRYLQLPDSEDGVVGASVLSRDGRTLIYSTEYGWVVGVSTRTGKQKWKRRVQNQGDVPVSIELSPDGSKFLRSSDDDNGEAQRAEVVLTRTGHVFSILRLPFKHPGAMRSAFSRAQFAPRGFQVAVFQSDTQQWVFFNARTARVKWKMGGPSRTSEGNLKWQWSPDARLIGVSGPKGFEVRDARSGRVLQRCTTLKGELTFSPDGSRVYALQPNDTGFGSETVLWQWRLFPTRAQRRADARFMVRLRRREERFALSPRHINESLVQAARHDDLKRVEHLLDLGANINTLDGGRQTLLENAINLHDVPSKSQSSLALVKLLVARGANINARGSSALAGAASGDFALTKFLLEHGAQVNGDASAYGTPTALFAAVEFGQLNSAKLLLSHGAKVDARNADGRTPLMQAIEHNGSISDSRPNPLNDLAIARLLLDHGADVNAHDKHGSSALREEVVWDNNPQLIQLLLERGADVNARGNDGTTALSLAKTPAIQAALQKAGAKP